MLRKPEETAARMILRRGRDRAMDRCLYCAIQALIDRDQEMVAYWNDVTRIIEEGDEIRSEEG